MPHSGAGSATHTLVGVGAASGTVLAANYTCHYRRLQNVGIAAVYLSFANGGAAVANAGIRLNGPGTVDSWLEMSAALGNLYQGPITAIGNTGTVAATEW